MNYNLKQHIAAQNIYVEAVADKRYFNEQIAFHDPRKGFLVEEKEEQIEEAEFDDGED